jgi:hypothetical protein
VSDSIQFVPGPVCDPHPWGSVQVCAGWSTSSCLCRHSHSSDMVFLSVEHPAKSVPDAVRFLRDLADALETQRPEVPGPLEVS